MKAKELIRDFFIKNYSVFTHSADVVEAEAVSFRYEEMLKHYINLAEKSGCKCSKGLKEILGILESNKVRDREYIQNG